MPQYSLVLDHQPLGPSHMHSTSSKAKIPVLLSPQKVSCPIKAFLEYNRRVRETPSFYVDNYVLIDKSLSEIALESCAHALASNRYNKLQRQTSTPYHFLNVRTNTVVVEEHGVLDIVSIDCVSQTTNFQTEHPFCTTPHKARQTTSIETLNENLAKTTPHKAIITDGYVLEKTTRHIGCGRGLKCIVPW